MVESATRPRRLTPKGQAMRQKIIEAAAGLIYERGVAGTNNELVRKAAGISGSETVHWELRTVTGVSIDHSAPVGQYVAILESGHLFLDPEAGGGA